jgi:hypothetical protein
MTMTLRQTSTPTCIALAIVLVIAAVCAGFTGAPVLSTAADTPASGAVVADRPIGPALAAPTQPLRLIAVGAVAVFALALARMRSFAPAATSAPVSASAASHSTPLRI